MHFQPATFSLQKTTAQMVQETVLHLQNSTLGIGDEHMHGYVPLPPRAARAPTTSAPEWNFRNPNHNNNYATSQQQQQQQPNVSHANFFAALQNEEDYEHRPSPTAPQNALAFQPASFTVATAGTFVPHHGNPNISSDDFDDYDDIDPDL